MIVDKVSDQLGTVESTRQLDDEAFVKGRSSVTRTQSEGDLNLNDKTDWPMMEEVGKRKKKHTERWLEYQSFQLEEKRSSLYGRLIRKSNAVNDLLYSPRSVEVLRHQMLQADDLFKMPAPCSSSKRSMVGSEMLRGKRMLPWKQIQKGQVVWTCVIKEVK